MARRLFACCALALLFLLGAAPVRAQEREFRPISQHDMLEVASDGSFLVRERRVVRFRGTFHRMFVEIARGSFTIDQVVVGEAGQAYRPVQNEGQLVPGTYLFVDTGDRYILQWYFNATDEERAFVLQYRVRGAVVRYSDVAELHWTFVGSADPYPLARATAAVMLPPGPVAGAVEAWLHPRGGSVTTQQVDLGGLIQHQLGFETNGLRANEPFEVRVAFPPALVPGAPFVPSERLPDIRAEEARRETARARTESSTGLESWGNRVAPAIAVTALVVVLVLLVPVRRRREDAEALDLDPALAAWVLRSGRSERADAAAAVLDLARRQVLRLEPAPTGFAIVPRGGSWDSCAPHERLLLVTLDEAAGEQGVVDDERLRAWAAANSGNVALRMRSFARVVAEQARLRGIAEPFRAPVFVASLLAGIVGVVLSLAALSGGAGVVTWLTLGATVLFLVGVARRRLDASFAWMLSAAGGVILVSSAAEPILSTTRGVFVAMLALGALAVVAPQLRRRAFEAASGARAWRSYADGLGADPDAARAVCYAAAFGRLDATLAELGPDRVREALGVCGLPASAGPEAFAWFITGMRRVFEASGEPTERPSI